MKTLDKRFSRTLLKIVFDMILVPVCWYGAYLMRYNLGDVPLSVGHEALIILPVLMLVQLASNHVFSVYRGMWRFASLTDFYRIVKSTLITTCVSALVLFILTRMVGIPRSVLPLYAIFYILLATGARALYRWTRDYKGFLQAESRVLIIGAGQAGEHLLRDLYRYQNTYRAVAFVDDSQEKKGVEIHGVRVRGTCEDIPKLSIQYDIELIFIAIPSASSAQMRTIVALAEKANIPVRTLPGLNALAEGRVSTDALREVSLEDLLGRDPVSLDWQVIEKNIRGKKVFVSGGGGSIGSELCRQIITLNPSELIIIEHSEYNLYQITEEVKRNSPNVLCRGYLCSVVDRRLVKSILSRHSVDTVFHAAAYKHVPMLENQVRAAMYNNIIGTRVLAEEAVDAGVKQFLLISTDKAVHPGNIMGSTKRCAEIICQSYDNLVSTKFITVRFGNVLGSAGSVIPLFKQQIARGGPVTVTHRDMTRYFMTIPEACQLILQALVLGNGSEIFVLDMGEPVKINYLAEQLILFSGRKPNIDIGIEYIGLRPGEKLHESLFHEHEMLVQTQHEKIRQAKSRQWDWVQLIPVLDAIQNACLICDEQALLKLLVQLVPEYTGNHDEHNINQSVIEGNN